MALKKGLVGMHSSITGWEERSPVKLGHLPAIKLRPTVCPCFSRASLLALSGCSSVWSLGLQGRKHEKLGLALPRQGEERWLLKEDC